MNLRRRFHLRESRLSTHERDAFFAWADEPGPSPVPTEVAATFTHVQSMLIAEEVTMERSRKELIWQQLMAGTADDALVASAQGTIHRFPQLRVQKIRRPGNPPMTPTRRALVVAFNLLLVVAIAFGATTWMRNHHDSDAPDSAFLPAATIATPTTGISGPFLEISMRGACVRPGTPQPQAPLGTPTTDETEAGFAALDRERSPAAVATLQAGPEPESEPGRAYAPLESVFGTCSEMLSSTTWNLVDGDSLRADLSPYVVSDRYLWEHDNPNLTEEQRSKIAADEETARSEIARDWRSVIAGMTFYGNVNTSSPFEQVPDDAVRYLGDGRIATIVYVRTDDPAIASASKQLLVTNYATYVPYFLAVEVTPQSGIPAYTTGRIDQFFPLCDESGCPPDLVAPQVVMPTPLVSSLATPSATPAPARS